MKDPNDTTRVTCNFCGKTTGGINRAKQHLIGNFRNASKCTKCPQKIREEPTKLHKRKKKKISLILTSSLNLIIKKMLGEKMKSMRSLIRIEVKEPFLVALVINWPQKRDHGCVSTKARNT